MKTAIITMGDITGRSQDLPDRKIIKEAQRAMCMSAEFWVRIKANKIPYIFDKEKNELVEASYSETVSDLNRGKGSAVRLEHLLAGTPAGEKKSTPSLSQRSDQIYWATDEEYPELNESIKNIAAAEELKQSYLQKIEKYKK